MKPIYFSARDIRGTTSTLYQPPEVTTSEDLELAVELLAETTQKNPKASKVIKDTVVQQIPVEAQKIVAVVEEKRAEQTTATDKEVVGAVVEEVVDTPFLNFRAEMFTFLNKSQVFEKTNSRSVQGRSNVAKTIAYAFQEKYPTEWEGFSGDQNYLLIGQGEPDYLLQLLRVFQGAENSEMIIT